jgi:hypothetical protein
LTSRISRRMPSLVTIWPVENLLLINRLSTIHCISSPRSKTKSPHHFSNCRYRSFSCSGLVQTLYCLVQNVLAG